MNTSLHQASPYPARWFTTTYRVTCAPAEVERRAQAIAVEQSVEMPLDAVRSQRVMEEIVGQVDSIEPEADGRFLVRIRLAVETTGLEGSQFLNMAFGNTSMHPDVEWVDVDLPPALVESFSGPRFGIAGIRELVGAHDRALTATALKPQGMPVEELAVLAHQFALGGLDIIKDDHGIANQTYAPFEKRIPAVQRAVARANQDSGGATIYAPTLSGTPSMLARQARIAREEGVRMVLVAPMVVGLPAFQELVREHVRVPVLGHPAFIGAQRIAPPLMLGKLFRLFGADAVIFANHAGRFTYSTDTCHAIADTARGPLGTLQPAMPVPAGGMTLERVPEMLEFYGRDVILLIGGALLQAGDRLMEASRDFTAAVRR